MSHIAARISPEESVNGNVDEGFDTAVARNRGESYSSCDTGHWTNFVKSSPEGNVWN